MARKPLKRTAAAALAAGLALSLAAAPAAYAKTSSSSSTEYVEGVVMSRLYNPYTGEHFYTSSEVEKAARVADGWNDEGDGWVAPKKSSTEVYRLYNPYAPGGDHHYTTSWAEVESLKAAGWRYEGVGWYSADSESVPLYRQYNPNAQTGTHNYTSSTVEKDSLVSSGWNDEEVAWYGLKSVQVKVGTEDVYEDRPVYEEQEVTQPAHTEKVTEVDSMMLSRDFYIAFCRDEISEWMDFYDSGATWANVATDVIVHYGEETTTQKVQTGTEHVKTGTRDVYETRYV